MTFGWWLLTEPDPSGLGEDRYGTARKIIRVGLVCGVANTVLDVGRSVMSLPPFAFAMLQIVDIGLGLMWVISFFAGLNYLRKLANRIPDGKMSNRAKFLTWAFGICGALVYAPGLIMRFMGPGTAIFLPFSIVVGVSGVAILVFGVMYLFLILRFGKRFREMATGAARLNDGLARNQNAAVALETM